MKLRLGPACKTKGGQDRHSRLLDLRVFASFCESKPRTLVWRMLALTTPHGTEAHDLRLAAMARQRLSA
jgi:hypothetical protein